MKEFSLKGLDQNFYYEKLSNGLDIYLIPYDNKNNYSMHYVVKYGSINNEFIPTGKSEYQTFPLGIAHFLEHKLFEDANGNDPFTFAAKTGTDCNASTSFKATRYLFEGNKGFEENLECLINFVSTPYFTDANVEKEKGIIIEEIKQYEDLIDWEIEDLMREMVFKVDPIKYNIAGNVESVKKITKEDLYDCYNTFYQPSNMFIIISGKFDKDKALEIIKKNDNLNNKITNNEIISKKEVEPLEVAIKHRTVKRNIMKKKLAYSIKIPIDQSYDRHEYILYIDLTLTILFGASSIIKEKLVKENKVTYFYFDFLITENYIDCSIISETEYPEEVIEEINKVLENIDIKKEDIERIKKVWIAITVKGIDNQYATLNRFCHEIIEYKKIITNKIDIYRSINKKDLDNIIKKIDFKNTATLIVEPKK